MRWALLCLWWSFGCLEPGVVTCDDGRICPASYRCAPKGCASDVQIICDTGQVCPSGYTCTPTGCASPEQVAACDGLAQGADCATSLGPGLCDAGVCTITTCGNGVVEIGEVCDDSNNMPDDGCDAKCKSTEVCGNGIPDYFANEQCDDGNARSGDGCSSKCLDEQAAWRRVNAPPSQAQAAKGRHVMAYDAARDRVVLFGGDFSTETWEYDGSSWGRLDLVVHPPPLAAAAMAYDAVHHRIVLFGGRYFTYYADTWTFDGLTWSRVPTSTGPGGLAFHAMAYDAARDRMVLFGGTRTGAVGVAETWEFDGAEWKNVATTGPPARFGHALAYDPVRGKIVLFGGQASSTSSTPLADTWEYDGTSWVEVTGAGPSARTNATLAYDPTRRGLVLFGGTTTIASQTLPTDTWQYTGTWGQVTTAGTPPGGRSNFPMVADPRRGRIVLYGGLDSNYNATNETWELGATWSQRTVPSGQVPQSGGGQAAMAYDSTRGVVVLFNGLVRETWELDGTMWTKRSPSTVPPKRQGHVMTFDAARNRIVMLGGFDAALLDDLWEYDGVDWHQVIISPRPAPRNRTDVTYDLARKKVVLFGGTGSVMQNDTWEYDGSTWTERVLPASPQPREQHRMTYDVSRRVVVLFGGRTGTGTDFQNDTWEYDGTTWTERTFPNSPAARTSHTLTYDAARKTTVLFGGHSGVSMDDTWEYEGTRWSEHLGTETIPSPREDHVMTYDAAHGAVVLYGGPGGNDTWYYANARHPTDEVCRVGDDADGDNKIGCADDDCWGTCSPTCSPATPAVCLSAPACGDGACTPLENCRNCPADCAVGTTECPIVCGDFACDGSETTSTCAGDCKP